MSNTIHDMRQDYERQLAAKDARIAALEAALRDARKGLIEYGSGKPSYPVIYNIDKVLEALDITHTAKSE